MLRSRLIPVLLLDGNRLVKTINFESPRYIGDPLNAIRILNQKEVDELVILDISATKLLKDPNYELIAQIASECFMPLCYGGGIQNIEQVKKLFQTGIEKISLRTKAIFQPKLISDIANQFGSQAIVFSLDTCRNTLGETKLYRSSSEIPPLLSVKKVLQNAVEAGAGEILLTSVDREGTGVGLDCALIQEVASEFSVPVIANGGLGNLSHAQEALLSGASAVAGSSFFVFHGKHKAVLITYPPREIIDTLISD